MVLAAANQAEKPKLQYKVKIPIFQPHSCQEREIGSRVLESAPDSKQGGCSRHGGLRKPSRRATQRGRQVRNPNAPHLPGHCSPSPRPPPPHPTRGHHRPPRPSPKTHNETPFGRETKRSVRKNAPPFSPNCDRRPFKSNFAKQLHQRPPAGRRSPIFLPPTRPPQVLDGATIAHKVSAAREVCLQEKGGRKRKSESEKERRLN